MSTTNEVDKRLSPQQGRIDDIHKWIETATLARQVGFQDISAWENLLNAVESDFLQGLATREARAVERMDAGADSAIHLDAPRGDTRSQKWQWWRLSRHRRDT